MTSPQKLFMKSVLFFTLGLASTLKEVGATSIDFDNTIEPENVHEYRRLRKKNKHLQKIDLGDWTEEEEEGAEIHLVELQLRQQYASDVDDITLAKLGEIQPSNLVCNPNSCKKSLDGYCDNCDISLCESNLHLMSEDPFEYPTYKDVLNTAHCDAQSVTWDVNDIYQVLSDHDETDADCRSLPVEMAIFDMGGTDAELVTSELSGLDASNYVIVDAQPFDEALTVCSDKGKEIRREQIEGEDCSRKNVIDLVKKTTYLMCRTCDVTYEQCVVKFKSGATRDIQTFQEAFPEAEVSFIYADPNIYMSSAVDPKVPEKAKCGKHKYNPTKVMREAALKEGVDISEMSVEDICAMEANIIVESAIMERGRTGKVNFVHADDALEKFEKEEKKRIKERKEKAEKLGLPKIDEETEKLKKQKEKVEKMKEEALEKMENERAKKMGKLNQKLIAAGDKYLGNNFEELEKLGGFKQ